MTLGDLLRKKEDLVVDAEAAKILVKDMRIVL